MSQEISRPQSATAARQSTLRQLLPLEVALLSALDDQFVSTSVVRNRARMQGQPGIPVALLAMLLPTHPISSCRDACLELERRGLADRIANGKGARWRRTSFCLP